MIKPDYSDNQRKNILYVTDLQSDLTPKPLVSSDHVYIPVKARLSQNLILLYIYQKPTSGLFILNTDNGDLKPLLPNSRTDLFSIENGRIFFIGDMNEPEYGYKLKPGGIIESEPRNTKKLFVAPVSSPLNPTLICKESILAMLLVSDNYFWLILDSAKPELWRISKDGKDKKKIIDMPSEWTLSMLTAGLSPNGKLLAIGVTNNNDFFGHRDLIIIDIEKSTIAYEYKGIPVQVSPLSSQSPSLNFIWLTDDTIRFSETVPISKKINDGYFQWVDLEVATGKRLLEQKYSSIELAHSDPAGGKPIRRTEGFFDVQWNKLFFKGEAEPIACTSYNKKGFSSELAACPGGEWAAYICYEDSIVYLVNGRDKTKKKIAEGYYYALCWLPGIE